MSFISFEAAKRASFVLFTSIGERNHSDSLLRRYLRSLE
jgi:hypothetical protein